MNDMSIHADTVSEAVAQDATIAATLAAFAESLRPEAIPAAVIERAKYLILDAVGIAHASTRYEFAHRSLSAATELSAGMGDTPVIGLSARLQLRDAMLMNGILVHGLDFDDTHSQGVIHSTAACFPTALGVAAHAGLGGLDLLAAYVVGMEAGTRLGSVAKGGFHQIGFHPTGLVGAFSAALVAGRLFGLNVQQLSMAQGIALSTGSGSLEFLNDGAWTKRMHPGWAAGAGFTAASLARHGFVGPKQVYEGRFGLFASHLGQYAKDIDLSLATAGLGEVWETAKVAVKPIPACHFTHACADAAAILRDKHGLKVADIRSVRALVPGEVVKTVCEPVATKKRPQNSYDAQFSIPYIVATALARGSFGLAHLDGEALADPEVLALAQRVEYEVDPDSPFPKYYSGEVIVMTHDGRELRHREEINRGAVDRPISGPDIEKKFMDNMALAVSRSRAEQVRDLVLGMDRGMHARDLAEGLAARG
ncbi:MmgE/PrpD family protein [Paralcaligenes sp. KSB-10]|uniref:MmgE/PrpD family protein n=1 Tax=Paralcaligenes sp. KSB-10 TaxID=2901142 RepID=UPI001E3CDBF7|nr:MmgE/PrpD family protein [Paralcaligenes sp. KSB-10]UHL64271.1 MmgE/PrpD family protein [Paralcaligenes sp. KSB-10]